MSFVHAGVHACCITILVLHPYYIRQTYTIDDQFVDNVSIMYSR